MEEKELSEHGEWIDCEYFDEYYGRVYKCNICGEHEIGEQNYCSSCGAKMTQAQIPNEAIARMEQEKKLKEKLMSTLNDVKQSTNLIKQDDVKEIIRQAVNEWLYEKND
jgi:hypothetical protein